MSRASSSADTASGADGLDGAGGADGALTVHCFSCSIILTRREMSRACDEEHCRRELCWRCIRRTEAAMREYVGRSCCEWQSAPSSLSLPGVGGRAGPQLRAESISSEWWLSCRARSPIVHGGVGGRGAWCERPDGDDVDVGDTFMAARSASYMAKAGDGTGLKEKSRNMVAMGTAVVEMVLACRWPGRGRRRIL